METTEQKINLQLNIDGYKFFETNQLFDDDQTYSNLIQGFMDDLDFKLENMMNSKDEPVNEELYYEMLNDDSLSNQDIYRVIDIVKSKF